MAQNWHKIELDWSILIQYFLLLMSSWQHLMHVLWQYPEQFREMMLCWRLSLFFYLIFLRQKIKENRIFKQKTRDISYRDRERRLPRRKVEYISSWRGKGSLVFTSHIFISHCVSLSSIHYTWFMCLHLHARSGCLVTPSCVSADQHSCPRVPVSLTDTPLSSLGLKPSPCRSRGRDIFPGSRLGSSLHSRTFLRSVASEICRDGPWVREEWRWSQEPVSGCLCRYRYNLAWAWLLSAWAGARHHT